MSVPDSVEAGSGYRANERPERFALDDARYFRRQDHSQTNLPSAFRTVSPLFSPVVVAKPAGPPRGPVGYRHRQGMYLQGPWRAFRRARRKGAAGVLDQYVEAPDRKCANLSWKLKRLQTLWFDGIGRNNIKPVRERSRDEESVTFGEKTQEEASTG